MHSPHVLKRETDRERERQREIPGKGEDLLHQLRSECSLVDVVEEERDDLALLAAAEERPLARVLVKLGQVVLEVGPCPPVPHIVILVVLLLQAKADEGPITCATIFCRFSLMDTRA
jgi:hypothetical protein